MESSFFERRCELTFLGQLHTLLTRGSIAYKNYMQFDKVFLYAKILKDNNEKVRLIILECCHVLPMDQQQSAIEILAHIDVWSCLWDELNKQQCPQLFDKFVFESDWTFPRHAADALNNYYLQLRGCDGCET